MIHLVLSLMLASANTLEQKGRERQCEPEVDAEMMVELMLLSEPEQLIWRLCQTNAPEPMCQRAFVWFENLRDAKVAECASKIGV